MLTKEDIIVSNLNISDMKMTKSDFENQRNELYILLSESIDELNITSLSKVIILDFSFSKINNGRTTYNLGDTSMSSQIELHKNVFIDFNNSNNTELKNKALETICHELYHVYNEENLFYRFAHTKISIEDSPYCRIGTKCWAEYLSYYKTQKYHMSEYPFEEFDIIYNRIQQGKPSPKVIDGFFYMISNICAYETNEQYMDKLEETTLFSVIRGNDEYSSIIKKFNSIMVNYPNDISGISIFTDLGRLFCDLITIFGYRISFNNKNMIIW